MAALRGSANSQWGSQITELDGAVEALKTTIAGISGDSLVSDLPTIVSDLQRIDTAWTALQQQIDQDCGESYAAQSVLPRGRSTGRAIVIRAMDSSARPCSWRTCGPRRAPIG